MDDKLTALTEAATAAREQAWAPYSNFHVGAALLTTDGQIFTGANVENSSYGLSVCAERIAVFKAVTAGQREFAAIVIVTDTAIPTPPCGACLQVMSEFAPTLQVHMVNLAGTSKSYTLNELMPHGFSNSYLAGSK
ncbi:MAG: cytidine deaminase [Candidatus Delongbacteria bacterium]|nr:cytidine deaminase [Candidatus Delongbacteria bacterium]